MEKMFQRLENYIEALRQKAPEDAGWNGVLPSPAYNSFGVSRSSVGGRWYYKIILPKGGSLNNHSESTAEIDFHLCSFSPKSLYLPEDGLSPYGQINRFKLALLESELYLEHLANKGYEPLPRHELSDPDRVVRVLSMQTDIIVPTGSEEAIQKMLRNVLFAPSVPGAKSVLEHGSE